MDNTSKPYSEFGYYIHRVVALIDKRGDQMFRQNLGISLTQFMLLRLFDTTDATLPSQQIIAERLGIAKSAVSRHLDIAVTRGWIESQQSTISRRQNTLTLTPAGKTLLHQGKKLIHESEKLGFGDMPASDVAATLRTLKLLHNKLGVPDSDVS